jgi:hypothetical protein
MFDRPEVAFPDDLYEFFINSLSHVYIKCFSIKSDYRGIGMQDLIFLAITIAFYAVSIGYVHFCDRMK